MKKYHLIRFKGNWVLKREGAKRSLINFGNKSYGDDIDQVISACMTYADDMSEFIIHTDDGTVMQKFCDAFVDLYRSY